MEWAQTTKIILDGKGKLGFITGENQMHTRSLRIPQLLIGWGALWSKKLRSHVCSRQLQKMFRMMSKPQILIFIILLKNFISNPDCGRPNKVTGI